MRGLCHIELACLFMSHLQNSWSCGKASCFFHFESAMTSCETSLLKSVFHAQKHSFVVVMRAHEIVCTALKVGAAGSDATTSHVTFISNVENSSWRIAWIVLSV